MTTPTELPSRVRGFRQMKRGFEAEVTLGVEGPPGGCVKLKVLVSPMDPELAELRRQFEELFVRKATAAVKAVVA